MVPVWIVDIFAALMLLVAVVSAARLVAGRRRRTGPTTADIDVAHLLMAIAMAGTLTAGLTTLPDTAWEIIFGLTTAWFAWRVWRDANANGVRALAGGHCAPHLVHSGAMLYMFLAAAAPAGGSGMDSMGGAAGTAMPALEYPTLTFVFALILAGYSVWDLDRLSGRRYSMASAAVSLAASGMPAMAAAEPTAAAFTGAPPAGDLAPVEASSVGEAVPGGGSGRRFASAAVLLSPGTTVGCRIVMGVTMAFMLVLMI